MNLSFWRYEGEADKEEMIALVRASSSENLHVTDLPYRFSSWAFDAAGNIGLWREEGGRLVAWAALQTPFWTIDYAYDPALAAAEIQRRIFDWADERARQARDTAFGHPLWFVNVRDNQAERRMAAEAAGFADQAHVAENPWSKVWLARPSELTLPLAVAPPGIILRPLNGAEEADSYVTLHRAAFGSPSMTVTWRQQTLQRPEYRPELDLVAQDADGNLAAFCIGWFDPSGADGRPCGQIEPLGVREDFYRQGLGRAILSEVLRRLYAAGVEMVTIEADKGEPSQALYEAVGFRVVHNVYVYRKEYAG